MHFKWKVIVFSSSWWFLLNLSTVVVMGGGHSHWPVYVMRLSKDPLFSVWLSLNAPYFAYSISFFRQNHQMNTFTNCSENFYENVLRIAQILYNLTSNDPPFWSVTQWSPFFARKNVTVISKSTLSCVTSVVSPRSCEDLPLEPQVQPCQFLCPSDSHPCSHCSLVLCTSSPSDLSVF